MIELKREINELSNRLGEPVRYQVEEEDNEHLDDSTEEQHAFVSPSSTVIRKAKKYEIFLADS
ncbi:MAG: hypothetical protein ABGX16_18430 [Pirellulales bacterium]